MKYFTKVFRLSIRYRLNKEKKIPTTFNVRGLYVDSIISRSDTIISLLIKKLKS